MLTEQQKNIKKMITDLGLKYDTMFESIYIEKNRKIKDIHDILFYLLNYDVIKTGEYIKVGDRVMVFKNGITYVHYNHDTGKVKIELYREE